MTDTTSEIAVFGGGCFWCTEAVFQLLKGIKGVMPGYAGGKMDAPSYEDVSEGDTGHAEVIQVTFDPSVIAYKDLLTVFFASHDPTTLNRQGADVGTQYRSAIFTTTPKQQEEAEAYIKEINASGEMGNPVVTEVKPLDAFYPAEGYHHSYYKKNAGAPYCEVVINPKLEKVKQKFAKLLDEA
jgi:peptide-methionine (S)-S-oxide reductase